MSDVQQIICWMKDILFICNLNLKINFKIKYTKFVNIGEGVVAYGCNCFSGA